MSLFLSNVWILIIYFFPLWLILKHFIYKPVKIIAYRNISTSILIKEDMMDKLKQMTDDMLVTLYLEGNNSAFDTLLNRHQDRLFNYIYFLVRSREVAEDIFQETFVKAITTLQQGRYQNDGKFSAWITRIAHNLVIDQFRVERNENTVSNDEMEYDILNDAKLSEGNIENRMVNEQVLKDVRALIDELPDCQREVVFMRYYQDLSFKDIADMTGVSINTALGRMRYALLNMRRIAEEKHIVLEMY
jgi:RNA polymerase sigma-70 factor (ECF subfamily)